MIKKVVIFILIITAFGAGIYFSAQGGPASGWKDNLIGYFGNLNKQVQEFQKTEVGQTISQVSKEIFSPLPLKAGGTSNNTILLQSKIISETNLQRQKNGSLPALKENVKLNSAASAKALDILKNQYFEHISPVGVDPGKLVQNFGYDYIVAGENLILGNFASEKEVVQDWMDSPGHRENILNNRYTEIGVAVVKGTYKGDIVWVGVQEFGLPSSACTEPEVAVKNKIDADKTQLDTLSTQITEKKKEIDNASQDSPVYSQMIDDYNKLVAEYNSVAEEVKTIIAKYNIQVNTFNACVSGK